MRGLARGIGLLLVLFTGFMLFDVLGRQPDEISNDTIVDDAVEIQVQTQYTPAVTPAPVFAAPLPPTEVPLTLVAQVVVPPSPTPAPKLERAAFDDHHELSLEKKNVPGESVFDALLTPFANEANKRRAELAKTDPEFARRIDQNLNQGRINFLLFGYGETHEPPNTERAIIGSHTIVSYDTRTRQVDIISLTHDIRGPEIERELSKQSGKKSLAVRIDQAYNVGGFKLMRKTLEDATGLSIDFQVTFKDSVMQSLIDNVFGGVEVFVPMAFDVHPFYLDGKKYNGGHFTQGLQRLNGRQVIQFIKTVPVTEGAYDKSLEHNVRKAVIFDALLEAVGKSYKDRTFWIRGSSFVAGELIGGSITYDFDPVSLMINNIGSTTASLRRSMSRDQSPSPSLPKIRQSKYVVDPAHGDGGVQWVGANAAVNALTRKEIEDGVYPSMDMEIPIDANANGDLPTEYWTSVRNLVNKTLTGSVSP
ncbi:MAG: LCP family protein [Acidobacteriota bacterium]